MNQEEIARRTNVILSCQQVLLRAITPNIRKVAIDWDEKNITIYFVYDGQFSDKYIAEAEHIASKMRLEFPGDFVKVCSVRIDFPTHIEPLGEKTIYFRKETYPN